MRCFKRERCTLKKLKSMAYSNDTQGKLNYLTLRINDPEIRQKYDDIRWKSFR